MRLVTTEHTEERGSANTGCLKFLTRLLLLAPAHITRGPRLPPLHASTHLGTTRASLRVVAGTHSQVLYFPSERTFIWTVKTRGTADPISHRTAGYYLAALVSGSNPNHSPTQPQIRQSDQSSLSHWVVPFRSPKTQRTFPGSTGSRQ